MSAMSAGCSFDEAFVGDLQLDAARRVGLEQIDELPRDDARRNPLEQRAQRERRDDALRRGAGWRRARRRRPTTTFSSDVAVDRRRFELDVVDADDLAAVDVDDLLVEQVALEEQDAVRRRVALPRRRRRSAARTVAPHDLSASAGSTRSPSAVLTIRYAMRVGWSCGATAISRTRPRTVPVASRTVAPSSSERATSDIGACRIRAGEPAQCHAPRGRVSRKKPRQCMCDVAARSGAIRAGTAAERMLTRESTIDSCDFQALQSAKCRRWRLSPKKAGCSVGARRSVMAGPSRRVTASFRVRQPSMGYHGSGFITGAPDASVLCVRLALVPVCRLCRRADRRPPGSVSDRHREPREFLLWGRARAGVSDTSDDYGREHLRDPERMRAVAFGAAHRVGRPRSAAATIFDAHGAYRQRRPSERSVGRDRADRAAPSLHPLARRASIDIRAIGVGQSLLQPS